MGRYERRCTYLLVEMLCGKGPYDISDQVTKSRLS